MKILLDTDILLDIALRREDFVLESAQVLDWAEMNVGRAAIAWHTLSNLAYLVRPNPRPFIRDLLRFTRVAPVGMDDALRAVILPMADFEDALQAASAIAFDASFIVSRNVRDYKNSPVPAIAPKNFLERLG